MNRKLHFGPGPNWVKPDPSWVNVDIDPARADVVINFNDIESLPFEDDSVECIYGSHVFEHIGIFNAPLVFKECHRVLMPRGVLRMVLPDVRKSIEEYMKGNSDYPLFKRRMESLKTLLGVEEVSLFEALKGDFISPSGQHTIFGKNLAHQNAWDYEAICLELKRAGFDPNNIYRKEFGNSEHQYFHFEGKFTSEANEYDRSLYLEATK